jgi:hypothetical protein
MAQAAERFEVPKVRAARLPVRRTERRRRIGSFFANVLERDRQRRQLAGYGSAQDVGRQTGIRG